MEKNEPAGGNGPHGGRGGSRLPAEQRSIQGDQQGAEMRADSGPHYPRCGAGVERRRGWAGSSSLHNASAMFVFHTARQLAHHARKNTGVAPALSLPPGASPVTSETSLVAETGQ